MRIKNLTAVAALLLCINAHASGYDTEITVCDQNQNLQKCIDTAKTDVVTLSEGLHETDGIHLGSNITFIIPKNSILKLADDAVLNGEAFGGEANFVIASIGKENNLIDNVHIVVDGEIDANRSVHVYEKGGVEGIDWKWIKNSTISGTGVIHSANGDGIDMDTAFNTKISDVTVKDNGDSGIHFGSPRPIKGSKNNVVINVTSINNGYRSGKSGFDLSWPNPDGVIYVNCTAIDNYRNYKIEASGGAVYNSKSVDSGKVTEKDEIGGADYVVINGENITNKSLISKKTLILIKRDIKKLFGMKYHEHLDGIEY